MRFLPSMFNFFLTATPNIVHRRAKTVQREGVCEEMIYLGTKVFMPIELSANLERKLTDLNP
jgi:hypothetical protein